MKTKALINLTVAAFVFLNVAGITIVNNATKQEPIYLITDDCGRVHVQRGTKPVDKNSWKWDYTRVCAWGKAYADQYYH